ncbi:hypothetical protein ACFLXX_03795 [Chloroflexota bacterium]
MLGARILAATISITNPQALAINTMRYGFNELASLGTFTPTMELSRPF